MPLEMLIKKLDEFKKFADSNRTNEKALVLGNHQLVPIFNAVENGLRRFVLAYGTGAGKSVIPIEILKHMRKKGENTKTLVIAPKQTLLENWKTEVLEEKYGFSQSIMRVKDKKTIQISNDAEFVTVNYDKLNKSLGYLNNLINYSSQAGMIIVDEFHNIKNRMLRCLKVIKESLKLLKIPD